MRQLDTRKNLLHENIRSGDLSSQKTCETYKFSTLSAVLVFQNRKQINLKNVLYLSSNFKNDDFQDGFFDYNPLFHSLF